MAANVTQESVHNESKTPTLNLRVDPEIKNMLAELAKANDQSITGWIKSIAKREHAKLRKVKRQPME